MKNWLRKKMLLPEYAVGYDLDDPNVTEMRKGIIMRKVFLRKLYEEWYKVFKSKLADVPQGKIVEIGSGAGFVKNIIPETITSDVMPLADNDMTFSAEDMPFKNEELSGIIMIDVLHHIPHPANFLKEAERTLKKGGKIVMVEPANSAWGKYIYTHFHHEPWEPGGTWEIPATGPLSGANGALPWIIFVRDRKRFEAEFPQLQLNSIKYHTPMRYLISGGVSMRALLPDWSFGFMTLVEKILSPIGPFFSMFQTIEIVKK